MDIKRTTPCISTLFTGLAWSNLVLQNFAETAEQTELITYPHEWLGPQFPPGSRGEQVGGNMMIYYPNLPGYQCQSGLYQYSMSQLLKPPVNVFISH